MQTQLKNSAIRFTTTVIKIDNKSARKTLKKSTSQ